MVVGTWRRIFGLSDRAGKCIHGKRKDANESQTHFRDLQHPLVVDP
jgi:hypothetical protein